MTTDPKFATPNPSPIVKACVYKVDNDGLKQLIIDRFRRDQGITVAHADIKFVEEDDDEGNELDSAVGVWVTAEGPLPPRQEVPGG